MSGQREGEPRHEEQVALDVLLPYEIPDGLALIVFDVGVEGLYVQTRYQGGLINLNILDFTRCVLSVFETTVPGAQRNT
ncbi:uncharacterized protein LOC122939911 isoform X2 [Bufo gargarizans]|uniref:uncharacterized protein LOC122939911 isoform X2 n=1 Tax=Bufo gargarizans TaxID=30331 RepID=UPI001CF153EC|nr:uncharacterized protein LOC122939911 isoform X2 [Bufo gargarizans]